MERKNTDTSTNHEDARYSVQLLETRFLTLYFPAKSFIKDFLLPTTNIYKIFLYLENLVQISWTVRFNIQVFHHLNIYCKSGLLTTEHILMK